MLQNKLATSFAEKRKNSFWTHVRKLNSSLAPTIDGVSGSRNIANVFASKLKDTLNTHSSSFHLHSSTQLTESDVCDVEFSEADVLEAIARLKSGKSDAVGEHVIMASSALANPLAMFFTSLLRHGYISQCLRDCEIRISLAARNIDRLLLLPPLARFWST